jgi:hypothetical protein
MLRENRLISLWELSLMVEAAELKTKITTALKRLAEMREFL